MTHSDITNIFKEMAIQHASLRHNPSESKNAFVRILYNPSSLFETKLYLEEFLEKNRNNLKFPCMLFFSTENTYQYDRDQVERKIFSGIFAIIGHKQRSFDNEQLEQMIDNTEVISEDVLARLYHMMVNVNRCEYLDSPDELYSHKIGPIMDDFYGTIMYYSFSKPIELFDTDRATDETIWL